MVHAVDDVSRRIRLASQTASKGVARGAQRVAAIGFVKDELADGDIFGDRGELVRPLGSCEDHYPSRTGIGMAGQEIVVRMRMREKGQSRDKEEEAKKVRRELGRAAMRGTTNTRLLRFPIIYTAKECN